MPPTLRILALLAAASSFLPATSAVSEYDIKAAYLLNILKLSDRNDHPAPKDSLTLCLLAPGPVARPLQALEHNLVKGRKLLVRTIASPEDLPGCDAAFVGRSSGARSLIAKANSLAILTIGNDSNFLPIGGAIALLVENRRVVIEINPHFIASTHWTISSHLLEIARLSGGER